MSDIDYFKTQQTLLMSYLYRQPEAMQILDETFRAVFRLLDKRTELAVKIGDAAARLSEDLAGAINSTCTETRMPPRDVLRSALTEPHKYYGAKVIRGMCILDGGKDDQNPKRLA